MISNGIALFPMAQRFVAILCKWFFAVEIHAFADENHISWNCSKHLKAVSNPIRSTPILQFWWPFWIISSKFQLPTSVLQQHTLLWLLCQFFWRKWTTIWFSVYNYPILPHATGFDRTEIGLSAFRFQDFNQKIVSPWFFFQASNVSIPLNPIKIPSTSHEICHDLMSPGPSPWGLATTRSRPSLCATAGLATLRRSRLGQDKQCVLVWPIYIYLSIDRSIDLSIYCIYLSVYLSIYLSTYLPIWRYMAYSWYVCIYICTCCFLVICIHIMRSIYRMHIYEALTCRHRGKKWHQPS